MKEKPVIRFGHNQAGSSIIVRWAAGRMLTAWHLFHVRQMGKERRSEALNVGMRFVESVVLHVLFVPS